MLFPPHLIVFSIKRGGNKVTLLGTLFPIHPKHKKIECDSLLIFITVINITKQIFVCTLKLLHLINLNTS